MINVNIWIFNNVTIFYVYLAWAWSCFIFTLLCWRRQTLNRVWKCAEAIMAWKASGRLLLSRPDTYAYFITIYNFRLFSLRIKNELSLGILFNNECSRSLARFLNPDPLGVFLTYRKSHLSCAYHSFC